MMERELCLNEIFCMHLLLGKLVDEGKSILEVEGKKGALKVFEHGQREPVHHMGAAPEVHVPHPMGVHAKEPAESQLVATARKNKGGRRSPQDDWEWDGTQEDVHVPLGRIHRRLNALPDLSVVHLSLSWPQPADHYGGGKVRSGCKGKADDAAAVDYGRGSIGKAEGSSDGEGETGMSAWTRRGARTGVKRPAMAYRWINATMVHHASCDSKAEMSTWVEKMERGKAGTSSSMYITKRAVRSAMP